MKYILYLHGFHSSPNSQKALIFKQLINENFDGIEVLAPQLAVIPDDAVAQLNNIMKTYGDDVIGIVGSSLGGFLATYLHNKFKKPIVVVNPAVKPFELLHEYLGEQVQPITGEKYCLTEQHMKQLESLYQQELYQTESIWLLQQEKDEVLDYKQAMERYKNCKITFELGGCHGFDEFERFPKKIAEFFLQQNSAS
jgi:predicted esterase YcpF (UPF0227 family)